MGFKAAFKGMKGEPQILFNVMVRFIWSPDKGYISMDMMYVKPLKFDFAGIKGQNLLHFRVQLSQPVSSLAPRLILIFIVRL